MSEETILKLLQDLDKNKAADLDNLYGKFLQDGATLLVKSVSQICKLSITYSISVLQDSLKKQQNGSNLISQTRNSKFILRIPS